MAADPYARYVYEDSGVLKNKLGETDEDKLRAFEYEWTQSQVTDALAVARSAPVLDAAVLKAVHAVLLGDIYEWAGHFRTIEMLKQGIPFQRIVSEDRINTAFSTFEPSGASAGNNSTDFAKALGRLWGMLNHEHPFVFLDGKFK